MQQLKGNIYAHSVTFILFGFNISNFEKILFSHSFSQASILNSIYLVIHNTEKTNTQLYHYMIPIYFMNKVWKRMIGFWIGCIINYLKDFYATHSKFTSRFINLSIFKKTFAKNNNFFVVINSFLLEQSWMK